MSNTNGSFSGNEIWVRDLLNYIQGVADSGNVLTTDQLLHVRAECARDKTQEPMPLLLDPKAPAEARVRQCALMGRWLYSTRTFSMADIAQYLNWRGQRTLRGRPWTASSLYPHLKAIGAR